MPSKSGLYMDLLYLLDTNFKNIVTAKLIMCVQNIGTCIFMRGDLFWLGNKTTCCIEQLVNINEGMIWT